MWIYPGYKIKQISDISKFNDEFARMIGYRIPDEYFYGEDRCGLFNSKGKLVGSFVLVKRNKLRSLEQIPGYIPPSNPNEWCEFTGYMLTCNNSIVRFLFTVYLVNRVLQSGCKYFVYSYPVSQVGLGEYYSRGNPIRLYRGKPKHLVGHTADMESEAVEVLTKAGIVRIFNARTVKVLKQTWREMVNG